MLFSCAIVETKYLLIREAPFGGASLRVTEKNAINPLKINRELDIRLPCTISHLIRQMAGAIMFCASGCEWCFDL
jgi:hypothetical protein